MSAFLTPLDMRLMRDARGMPLLTRQGRQLYQLLASLRYQSDIAGLVEVPEGFVTDLASIPQLALALLGDIAQEPAVPHDYIYNMHTVPRETADSMLYEACLLTGVPRWKAWLIYQGVRIGGASHWSPSPDEVKHGQEEPAA
jgi:hypothetical protein